MSDSLEDFIRNNRSELDIDEPSSLIWNEIEGKIPSSNRRRLYTVLSVAASVMILVVAAYFMGLNSSTSSLDPEVFASAEQYQEFQEASHYYNTEIDYKIAEAKEVGMDSDVVNDLKQLDEVYNELKEELLTTEYQDKEYLIHLMIKNYKTKISILERIINKNDNNNYKTTKDETLKI